MPDEAPEFGDFAQLEQKLDALGEERVALFRKLTEPRRPRLEAYVDIGLVPYGPEPDREDERVEQLRKWIDDIIWQIHTGAHRPK